MQQYIAHGRHVLCALAAHGVTLWRVCKQELEEECASAKQAAASALQAASDARAAAKAAADRASNRDLARNAELADVIARLHSAQVPPHSLKVGPQ